MNAQSCQGMLTNCLFTSASGYILFKVVLDFIQLLEVCTMSTLGLDLLPSVQANHPETHPTLVLMQLILV